MEFQFHPILLLLEWQAVMGGEGRPQTGMPIEEGLKRPPQGRQVQSLSDGHRPHNVVTRALRGNPLQKPQRLLTMRERMDGAVRLQAGDLLRLRRLIHLFHRPQRLADELADTGTSEKTRHR
jgi:hypothetical protein